MGDSTETLRPYTLELGTYPMKPPFFLLGCVRSGTTFMRNVLRRHPELECPEETNFFRWGEPFGTPTYLETYARNPHLRKHREIDGISEESFQEILRDSTSRRSLNDAYGKAFLRSKETESGRWFDKTPQNVYGLLLLSAQFPDSRFVHMVRNPLNVVASLKIGKVIQVESLVGATNYWREAVMIVRKFQEAWGDRILDVRYEELVSNPQFEVDRCLTFLGETPGTIAIPPDLARPEKNKYREVLTDEDIEFIVSQCAFEMKHYGYGT